MQVVAYTLQAAALPFPVFVLAAVINGAGLAIQVLEASTDPTRSDSFVGCSGQWIRRQPQNEQRNQNGIRSSGVWYDLGSYDGVIPDKLRTQGRVRSSLPLLQRNSRSCAIGRSTTSVRSGWPY
jgi:hypothetical protein